MPFEYYSKLIFLQLYQNWMLIKQMLYKDSSSSLDAILVLSRLPPLPEDLSGPPLGFLSSVKVLVNEDTLLRTHCCPWCFLGCPNWKTLCCGYKMFLNKIRNIFCVTDTKFFSQQMLRARANGETFVSATMCRQQCVLVCQGLYASSHCSPRIAEANCEQWYIIFCISSIFLINLKLETSYKHFSSSISFRLPDIIDSKGRERSLPL